MKTPTTNTYLFDFDGTLADTFSLAIQSFNSLSQNYGYQKITEDQREHFRSIPAKHILKQLNIAWYKIPKFLTDVRKQMKPHMKTVQMIKGMSEALDALYKQNHRLGIITSNSVENVDTFLKKNQCEFFDFIYSSKNLFRKSAYIKKIISSNEFDRNSTFYIGDETRDIDAAKQCNIKSVAVTWGFNNKRLLSSHYPDFIFDSPSELMNLASP